MNDSLELIKEKVEWIKEYLEHIDLTAKRTAELLFRATQIPRKTSWQDSYILELVEMCEKQRLQHDKLSDFYRITVINDANDLYDVIKKELDEREKEKQVIMEFSNKTYSILEEKRSFYIDSIKKDENDSWLCLADLKQALNNYLIEKDVSEQRLKTKSLVFGRRMEDIIVRYKNIIRNFMKIQANHHKNLCDILYAEDVEQRFFELEEEVFYDIDNKNEQECSYLLNQDKEINKESDVEVQFKDLIDQIHKDLSEKECNKNEKQFPSPNKLKKVDIRKYGIFKYKKGNRGSWKSVFIVLTENAFIHGFDIESIIKNSPNISAEYNLIYKRILGCNNEATTSFVSIFDNPKKIESLNLNEEKELLELSKKIINESNLISSLIKNFSFKIIDKDIKHDKCKFEILFSGKGSNPFTNFFTNSTIRLKAYILKDLYELLFGINKKVGIDIVTDNESEIINSDHTTNNDDIKPEIKDKEMDDNNQFHWTLINEENPWEE